MAQRVGYVATVRRCFANQRTRELLARVIFVGANAGCSTSGAMSALDVTDATTMADTTSMTDGSLGDVTVMTDTVARSDVALMHRDVRSVLSDGWVGGEAGHFECAMAGDCAGRMPVDQPFNDMRWSCIAGRCTYELEGNRTCDFSRALGCVRCLGIPIESCPGALCTPEGLSLSQLRIERPSLCGLSVEVMGQVSECFNGIVRLNDGSFCTLMSAPTGAIRYVLSCGGCAAVLVPRN